MNGPVSHVVTINHPTQEALARGPAAAVSMAESFVVDSTVTFELAADEVKEVKLRKETLEAQRKSITAPLDAAKKSVMDLFRGPVEALEGAEKVLKSKMLTYQQEEQRRAAADRIERERAAQAERERLLAEVQALEAAGKPGEAYVVQTIVDLVVAGPVQTEALPKAAGISTSSTYQFEVIDLLGLVQYIAAHPQLVGLLTVDSVKLRAHVRSLGMSCALPGVRVFKEQSIRARK